MIVFILVGPPKTLKLQNTILNANLEGVVRDVCIHLDDRWAVFRRVLRFHAGRHKYVVNNPLACLSSYTSS